MSDIAYVSERTSSMHANFDVYIEIIFTRVSHTASLVLSSITSQIFSHILHIFCSKGSTFTSGIIICDN